MEKLSSLLLPQAGAMQRYLDNSKAEFPEACLIDAESYTKAIKNIRSFPLAVWLYKFYYEDIFSFNITLTGRLTGKEMPNKLIWEAMLILAVQQTLIGYTDDRFIVIDELMVLCREYGKYPSLVRLVNKQVERVITKSNFTFSKLNEIGQATEDPVVKYICDNAKFDLVKRYGFVSGLTIHVDMDPPMALILEQLYLSNPESDYFHNLMDLTATWPDLYFHYLSTTEIILWVERLGTLGKQLSPIRDRLLAAFKERIGNINSIIYLCHYWKLPDLESQLRTLIEERMISLVDICSPWDLVDGLLMCPHGPELPPRMGLSGAEYPTSKLAEIIRQKLITIIKEDKLDNDRVVDFLSNIYQLGYFPDVQVNNALVVRATALLMDMKIQN